MESVNTSILWRPSERVISHANIVRFADFFRSISAKEFGNTYSELHAASLREPGKFWTAVWEFCEVIGDRGSIDVVPSNGILGWKWFPQSKLNFAEELLKPAKLASPAYATSTAIVAANESGETMTYSREELYFEVCRMANFLQSQGVAAGDRVVAVIPNIVEAVVGLLATASLGAIWSSCSPEFGEDAICDRFGQIGPRVLITSANAVYNGKQIRPIEKVSRVLQRLPSLQTLIVIGDQRVPESSLTQISWSEAINSASSKFEFHRFAFDHPLCILYSSGTTGAPKCIMHGIGGTLLQHVKEHVLHTNIKPDDRLFYYTTTGWMMWNWLVTGLASEAAIVLFDGSPLSPTLDVLWRLAESEGVTHFGASPRYFSTLEKESVRPCDQFSLRSLRCVLSTGAPLLPESFDWIYDSISQDVNLASISGGTDILSCFVLGNPTLPVYRGEIQCKALGLDVQVFDELGKKVIGQPGELVCAAAFPSMPIGFWNDPFDQKYRAAYFDKFENVWCHGDWAEETHSGGYRIFGRSDATLNPSGVRIGTAEIYQQVGVFPEIAESLATVLRCHGDEQIVLFVKLSEGKSLDQELVDAIRQRLRDRCSARHVPAFIAAAPDLPRTISGKLSEIAVRSALAGTSLGNSGALANPESLEFFRMWRNNRTDN